MELEPGDSVSHNRVANRLKKGLRWRTLRLRALSLIKIQSWCEVSQGGRWPRTESDLVDYMNDLATNTDIGVSAFERARCAVLYLEAAVGVFERERVANGDTLKSTIRELILKATRSRTDGKKQAPQSLAMMLFRWE